MALKHPSGVLTLVLVYTMGAGNMLLVYNMLVVVVYTMVLVLWCWYYGAGVYYGTVTMLPVLCYWCAVNRILQSIH